MKGELRPDNSQLKAKSRQIKARYKPRKCELTPDQGKSNTDRPLKNGLKTMYGHGERNYTQNLCGINLWSANLSQIKAKTKKGNNDGSNQSPRKRWKHENSKAKRISRNCHNSAHGCAPGLSTLAFRRKSFREHEPDHQSPTTWPWNMENDVDFSNWP